MEPNNADTMNLLVTLLIVLFYLTAFAARALLQWRRTGHTGFVGLRPGSTGLERFAGSLMAMVVVAAPMAPWIGAPLFSQGQGIGVALAVAGIVITLIAQVQMGDSWRVGVDDREHTALVTHGAFAVVRNPIFSAMLLAVGGLALAAPTPLALSLPPLLLVSLQLQVRWVEEPYLVRTHGEAYLKWASRTGRFVPGLGRLGQVGR